MSERRVPLWVAVLVGTVVAAAGPVIALWGSGPVVWLGWSPVAVFIAALVLKFRNEDSVWAKGLALGLGIGLLVSAGVCMGTFTY